MIHGTCIFSMADLGNDSGHLMAKIKIEGEEFECEVMQDNSLFDGPETSEIRVNNQNGSISMKTVKTNKLYDFHHENSIYW